MSEMNEKPFVPSFNSLDGQFHLQYKVKNERGEMLSHSFFADPTLEGLVAKVARAHIQSVRALHRAKKMLKD
jgi:hypothetical protein